ncbi:unnamed protein product, partial [Thlaspi arvense]
MASAASKLYSDDVSLLVLLLDTNPFFWSSTSITFSQFLSHVLAFLNAVLGLNQLNQVVVIATGYSSCDYIYDSSLASSGNIESSRTGTPALFASLLEKLEDFIAKDEELIKEHEHEDRIASSLLSGSLSMALCYIQRVFRSGHLHPQPRILCLQGSPDGPEQYVAVMNSIFSAQRLMVPIDSCYIGTQSSAFLQQASYITGGVHHTPKQLDGLFQYLTTIFATDLHSRGFVQLPKPVGVDFRASCFCHKKTIDMGYICSVCLSIFCEHHKKCSTCGLNLMVLHLSLIGREKLPIPKILEKKGLVLTSYIVVGSDSGPNPFDASGYNRNHLREKEGRTERERSSILEKKRTIHDLIKRASSISDPLSPFDSFRRYRKNDLSVYLESGRGDRLSSSVKQHIRKLLKTNMEGFYGSNWPLQAKVKRKEMSCADAHYIFVCELCDGKAYETSTRRIFTEGCNQIDGFVHYRFTLEEEIPVLYVYEIQLESRIQGKGLGEFLMQLIELIASKNRMSAIVLTVQTSNALAMTFYMSKLGYKISSISPSKTNIPTILAKYEILCKTLDSEAKSVLETRSDEDLVPSMAVQTRDREIQNTSNA